MINDNSGYLQRVLWSRANDELEKLPTLMDTKLMSDIK
jgi:hypothetical protein